MRFLFRLIGGIFLLLPFMLASLIFFALEQQPLVENSAPLHHSDINRARNIIRNNDPRKLQQGQLKSVTISASDLSVALNYLRAQFIQGGIETSFTRQAININATVIFPNNPIGKYLNLKLTLIPDQKKFAVKKISIGKVSIPPDFIQKAFALYADIKQGQQLAAVANMLQSVQISHNKLHLSYIWNTNTLKQAKDLIITQQDKNTLLDYQQQLAEITQKYSSKRQYSLTVLLQPLFRYAAQRSVDHDPVQENRALITVLAAYANGRSLKKLTGSEGAKTKHLRLTLQHRHDFVQHYTISAGLSAGTEIHSGHIWPGKTERALFLSELLLRSAEINSIRSRFLAAASKYIDVIKSLAGLAIVKDSLDPCRDPDVLRTLGFALSGWGMLVVPR